MHYTGCVFRIGISETINFYMKQTFIPCSDFLMPVICCIYTILNPIRNNGFLVMNKKQRHSIDVFGSQIHPPCRAKALIYIE